MDQSYLAMQMNLKNYDIFIYNNLREWHASDSIKGACPIHMRM